METILATAFGRRINIQQGEADELTRVVRTFFSQSAEGQVASRDVLVMLNSELPLLSLSLSQYYRSFSVNTHNAGNFPFMVPVFRYLFSKTKDGEDGEKLVKIALELVQARKESGKKVSVYIDDKASVNDVCSPL